MCLDWRGEFLQVVQEAFGKEREMLRAELQPQPCGSDPGNHSSLLERLEKVVQEQVSTCLDLFPRDRNREGDGTGSCEFDLGMWQ